MTARGFSFSRLFAILMKEFIQMRRDRMTLGLMIGVPLMQLLLFGFAINTDPRHLPTVVHVADDSVYARSIAAALVNSEYFDIVATARTPQDAERMLDKYGTGLMYVPEIDCWYTWTGVFWEKTSDVWVEHLAKTRRVIAVEMQGHGRTADTDRPMTLATMGDDIAALLEHLEI